MTSVIHHYSVDCSFEVDSIGREADACEAHSLPGTIAAAQTPDRITPCLGV